MSSVVTSAMGWANGLEGAPEVGRARFGFGSSINMAKKSGAVDRPSGPTLVLVLPCAGPRRSRRPLHRRPPGGGGVTMMGSKSSATPVVSTRYNALSLNEMRLITICEKLAELASPTPSQ